MARIKIHAASLGQSHFAMAFWMFLAFVTFFLGACACAPQRKTERPAESKQPPAVDSELLPLNFPSRAFELTDNIVSARLPQEQLNVERDPFFREPRTFVAFKTKDLLLSKVPELAGLKQNELSDIIVTFVNLDRKRLIVSLTSLLSETSYLAVKESLEKNLQTTDTTKLWSLLPGTPYPQTLGPAYLIFLRDPLDEPLGKVSKRTFSFPRIVKVIVSQRVKELGRIEPTEPEHRLGFELFIRNCAVCHTLHNIGSRNELELVKSKPGWQGSPQEAAGRFVTPLSAAHSQALLHDAATDLKDLAILTKIFSYLDSVRKKNVCASESDCNRAAE